MVVRAVMDAWRTDARSLPVRRIPEIPAVARCAACGGRGRSVRDARQVGQDLRALYRYWDEVTRGALRPTVTLNDACGILECEMCRSLWRSLSDRGPDRLAERWRDDAYGADSLERIHRRLLADYRRDARWFDAAGVGRDADVLEIGSYTGAFLSFAEERGARAVGVDVGAHTVAFARQRIGAARIERDHFVPSRHEPESYDVVAVLNCFEQLANPRAVLGGIRRLLRPGGRIVIRTPNAAFLAQAFGRDAAWQAAACRNLLWGMPFVHCYTPDAVRRMLVRVGFAIGAVRTREFARVAPPEMTRTERLRGFAFQHVVRPPSLGPWIDVIAEAAVRGD